MKPIEFPEHNFVYAKDQPQYKPLPVHKTEDGVVVSCWSFTWRERIRLFLGGKLWVSVLTFNRGLNPMLPSVDSPFNGNKV